MNWRPLRRAAVYKQLGVLSNRTIAAKAGEDYETERKHMDEDGDSAPSTPNPASPKRVAPSGGVAGDERSEPPGSNDLGANRNGSTPTTRGKGEGEATAPGRREPYKSAEKPLELPNQSGLTKQLLAAQ